MEPADNLKPLMITLNDAVKLSGLGRTKLYELINDGTVKSTTVGRRRLVVYASLEALAQGNADGEATNV